MPYHANSWQDTVSLPMGEEVVIRKPFRNFVGKFVYHCHILNHEDAGMMGQFLVVPRTPDSGPSTLLHTGMTM